jgi:Spy/CpxP family protein refolding chaperone
MNRSRNTLLAACLILTMTGVWAKDGGGTHGPSHEFGDPERMVEHMIRRLDLDDTQAQSVKNIVEAARPEMTELRNRARENHKAVRELDAGDADFGAKLSNLAHVSGELATQATLLHGRLRAEINAVLTPEQRQKLADNGPPRGERWRQDR